MNVSGTELRAIVTDIEGTTTSVAFVYDVLFPYFSAHIEDLLSLQGDATVKQCFDAIKTLLGPTADDRDVIEQLRRWVAEDRKETHLKTLQGVLWQKAYEQGQISGHIYEDVPPALKRWHAAGLTLAIYSSGSVAAQKLLFGFSDYGDLRPYFSHYFDTHIGHKREPQSYARISEVMALAAGTILFLSDIEQELDAAAAAGMQTLQLVRPGTKRSMKHLTVTSFADIRLNGPK